MSIGPMPQTTLKINVVKKFDGTFELKFIRNKRSMFCMDVKMDKESVKNCVEKIERYACDCGDTEYQLNLVHTCGNKINLMFYNDFDYHFDTKFVISYPTNRNGAIWYNDRKATVSKLEFLRELYNALISMGVDVKSELIESILEMNDLQSYYDRCL